MTLAEEARTALDLTKQAFADLLGTNVSTVRRWERGQIKPGGPALLCLRLIAAAPHLVNAVLAGEVLADGVPADKAPAGFTGDGGPPPARGGRDGPLVDEFGFTDVEGPAPEPDVGWAPGDEIGTAEFSLEFDTGDDPADPAETADDLAETGDFFTPGFDGGGGDEE